MRKRLALAATCVVVTAALALPAASGAFETWTPTCDTYQTPTYSLATLTVCEEYTGWRRPAGGRAGARPQRRRERASITVDGPHHDRRPHRVPGPPSADSPTRWLVRTSMSSDRGTARGRACE